MSDKNLTCPICGKQYKTLTTYKSHLKLHEDSKQYPNGIDCPLCYQHFLSKKSFFAHVSKHHTLEEAKNIYLNFYSLKEIPKCENCGKEAVFISMRKGFSNSCENCSKIIYKKHLASAMKNIDYSQLDWSSIVKKRQTTCKQKYGVDNVFKSDVIKQKIEDTMLSKYGVKSPLQSKAILDRAKETCITKYGVDNPRKNKNVINKCLETKKSNLNIGENLFTKSKNTFYKNNGVYFFQQSKKTRELTKQVFKNKYGVENPLQYKIFYDKMRKTKKDKYANGNFRDDLYKDKDFVLKRNRKMFDTKRKNNSFNISTIENNLYSFLKENTGLIIERQKFDMRFPYSVDFYFPQFDLFVDFNGHWTHGNEPFDKNNSNHLLILKSWLKKAETSKYWKNAVYVWTDLDVRKKNESLNINYLSIYEKDFDSILKIIKNKIENLNKVLVYIYDKETKAKELEKILFKLKGKDVAYDTRAIDNKIVLSNQPNFYKKENELFRNVSVQEKLINNRVKYLNKRKEDLTDKELLRGFKISGIWQGFSHFNWEWEASFIKEFNIKSVYDPCGGWGHRFMGALNIKYIYNDIDFDTYSGVININNFCKKFITTKKVFYNEDASKFTPKEKYEAIFTCPPYWNQEKYFSENSSSNFGYAEWLLWLEEMIKHSSCNCLKYVAIVMYKDYIADTKNILNKYFSFIKEQPLGQKINDFKNKSINSSKDILLVYKI